MFRDTSFSSFLIPIYILPTHEETTNFYGDCPFSIDGLWRKSENTAEAEKIDYTVEQFADLQILRYRVPGFEDLSLKQKELVYYLTEAALQGRDILFDQNGKYNLTIRRMLEAVYTGYK